MKADPLEQNNLIEEVSKSRTEELEKIRTQWNKYIIEIKREPSLDTDEVKTRLRRLGYIE